MPTPTPVHGTARTVAFDQLVAPDDNVRSELTDIDDLAASIATSGLLQPLVVEHVGDQYVITAGFRRHAAIGKLIKQKKWTGEVPVMVRQWASPADRELAMLFENLARVDINVVDEAKGVQRLALAHGLSAKEIATKLNRSVAHVKDRIALTGLPDKALDLLRDGTMSVSTANALTKAPSTVQDKLLNTAASYQLSSASYVQSAIDDYNKRELLRNAKETIRTRWPKVTITDQSWSLRPPSWVQAKPIATTPVLSEVIASLVEQDCDESCTVVLTATNSNVAQPSIVCQLFKPGTQDVAEESSEELRAAARAEELQTLRQQLPSHLHDWYDNMVAYEKYDLEFDAACDAEKTQLSANWVATTKPTDIAAVLIESFATTFCDRFTRAVELIQQRNNLNDGWARTQLANMAALMQWDVNADAWLDASKDQIRQLIFANGKALARAAGAQYILSLNGRPQFVIDEMRRRLPAPAQAAMPADLWAVWTSRFKGDFDPGQYEELVESFLFDGADDEVA